jgi:hypothetical protein
VEFSLEARNNHTSALVRINAFFSMVRIKATIAVRPELVEGRNRGFITFMLRQAQHERSEFSLGTYHCFFSYPNSAKTVTVQEESWQSHPDRVE